MASAGRILIMPKGNYKTEAEYEMLDMVYHNGCSWIAKKSSKGIEPSVDNEEYWQKVSDLSVLEEKKQDKEITTITIKSGERYVHTFGYGESCMLYAYISTMEYACIYSCCGINEWSYSINKLSESILQSQCSANVGNVGGEDLNKITFINESNEDKVLILVKLPFFPL